MPPRADSAAALDQLRATAEQERRQGIIFLLETRQPEPFAAVERVAKDHLGAAGVVAPLFETSRAAGDPYRLGTFFVARLPGLRFADLPQSPYDWAYAVRDRCRRSSSLSRTSVQAPGGGVRPCRPGELLSPPPLPPQGSLSGPTAASRRWARTPSAGGTTSAGAPG